MATIDRKQTVFLGRGKDAQGYPLDVVKTADGLILHVYELEVWETRQLHRAQLRLEQERQAAIRRRYPTGTPRHTWPARPPRKE